MKSPVWPGGSTQSRILVSEYRYLACHNHSRGFPPFVAGTRQARSQRYLDLPTKNLDLMVAMVAMPVMYFFERRKLDVAGRLGSHAMRADAVESLTCGWLSFVVVVGLLANRALAAWWIDAVTSLAIVWFVIREAREAWNGEECRH
jgi:hypothetical protein